MHGGHRQGFHQESKQGRYHRGGEELRLRLFQRARPHRHQGSGGELRHRGDLARIFYRNAINIGLPIIECPEAARGIEAGDEVEVDFDSGVITNVTKGTSFQGQAFPEFMQRIISSEGLINYINSQA